MAVRVGLFFLKGEGLLVGGHQLVALQHQRLLKLFLRLGLQQFLAEGDIGKKRGEGPSQLNGRLGAFLGGGAE